MGKPSLKWQGINFAGKPERSYIAKQKSPLSKALKVLPKLSDEELTRLVDGIRHEITSRMAK